MKKLNKFKKSGVAYAFLLASSPVLASPTKIGGGQAPNSGEANPSPSVNKEELQKLFAGKTQPFYIKSIALDKDNKGQECPVPKNMKPKMPRPRSILSLAFDPKKEQKVTLQFEMVNIPTSQDERVLVLFYSRCLSTQPKIKTPKSRQKLVLDTRDVQIMDTYKVPAAIPSTKSSTNSAPNVSPSPASIPMNLEVEFKIASLAKQVKSGNDTFYFQAALLKKTDFGRKDYQAMILSPLEAIHITASQSCPSQAQFSRAISSENVACKKLPTKTE